MMRVLAVAVVALGLVAGSVAVPANAVTYTPITLSGHVLSEAGKPLAGIRVFTDCACGFEGPAPKYANGKDTTSASGYYSFTVLKEFLANVHFEDPAGKYLAETPGGSSAKRHGKQWTLNAKLARASQIAGTVRADDGSPVEGIEVRPYFADTGKRASYEVATTDAAGHFHLTVPAGDYKLEFIGAPHDYADEWYSDAVAKDSAAIVTTTAGKKTSGVNATITKTGVVSGTITRDGQKLVYFVNERVVVVLRNAAGAQVAKSEGPRTFRFRGLRPGTYTLEFTPAVAGSQFFVPYSQTVEVGPGLDSEGLGVNLVGVAPTAADPASRYMDVIKHDGGSQNKKKGDVYRTTVKLTSYGSVAGGTITFSFHGKNIATKTVPASGVVTFSTRLRGVPTGVVHLRARFHGTDTVKPKGANLDYIVVVAG